MVIFHSYVKLPEGNLAENSSLAEPLLRYEGGVNVLALVDYAPLQQGV